MAKTSRILVLYSRLPYPLIGGDRMRVFQVGRLLSRVFQVDLLCLSEHAVPEGTYTALERAFARIQVFEVSKLTVRLKAIRGLLTSSIPMQAIGHVFKPVQEYLVRHLSEYDLIYCHHIRMAPYVFDLDCPKLIDFHDAISMNYGLGGIVAQTWMRYFYMIERGRLLDYELACLGRFPEAFINSEADRRYLLDRAPVHGDKLRVIPMGVRQEILERPVVSEEDNVIAFLGKMDYLPNEDAVLYFATEVLPLVRKEDPLVRFMILGAYPSRRVLNLRGREGIEVTGFIDDPYRYLERAKIVVAPMRFGAGIQNKILEGMALRRAVIASPLAARGVAAQHGKHLMIGGTSEELAHHCVVLLREVKLRRSLGYQARALIEEKYTWDVVGEMIVKEIEGLMCR